jgi:hypothetical protein
MPFFRFKPMLPFPGRWVVAILALAISVPFHVSAVGFVEPAAIAFPSQKTSTPAASAVPARNLPTRK